METFGEKVRQAVESQGLPLDEVAEATGLGIGHIQALERNDFGSLPDDDIVREALRSLARLVDVDPDEVVADYCRERQRWLAAMPAEAAVAGTRKPLDEPERIEPKREWGEPYEVDPSPRRSGRAGRFAMLSSAILALMVLAFLFWSRSSTTPESGESAVAPDIVSLRKSADETRNLPAGPADMAVSPKEEHSRPPDLMVPDSAIEQPTDDSELSIRQSGVGRGVVNHELVGEAAQFAEGERVWFWTRIEGGTSGESIEHVWLREGEEALRVHLRLGGARWRTKSYKDLNPGSNGNWVVEARDEAGRLLARREFHCSRLVPTPAQPGL